MPPPADSIPLDRFEVIMERFVDAQFELSGQRPDRRVRPAVVPYNLTLTASQNKSDSFFIKGSVQFICTELRWWSTGPCLLKLRPSSMTEDFCIDYVNTNALFGPAASTSPFPLPKPWKLENMTNMSIDLLDLSGAANQVSLAMLGYRVDP